EQSVAAKTRSRLINAVNGKRLTVLERENPVGFPASQYGVDSLPAVGEITFPGADRQFIGAAEMENLGDIEVAEAVISLNTESGEQRSAIGKRSFVQHVHGIRAALCPREVCENLQARAQPALVVELQRMVVTIPRETR